MMRRVILGLLLAASLLTPEAQAQSYAQTDKLSLEALTAPPVGGSGGGYAPVRHRAARAYHSYRAPRAYRHRAYRYGTPRAYRHRGYQHRAYQNRAYQNRAYQRRAYQHRASPAYGRHAPRRYAHAAHGPYGAPSGHGPFRFRSALRPGAYHAARRAPAFAPHHAGRAHPYRR